MKNSLWMGALLAVLSGCGGDDETPAASEGTETPAVNAEPRDVAHLLDQWHRVNELESRAVDVVLPEPTALDDVFVPRGDGTFLASVHWPTIRGTLQAESASGPLPRRATQERLQKDPGFMEFPTRRRWQTEDWKSDKETTAKFQRMVFTRGEPAHLSFAPQQSVTFHAEFLDETTLIRFRVRTEQESPAKLSIEVNGEVVGSISCQSTDWKLQETTVPVPPSSQIRLVGAGPDPVRVDWVELDSEKVDRVLARPKDGDAVGLTFIPIAPRPAQPVESPDQGAALLYLVGGPASLQGPDGSEQILDLGVGLHSWTEALETGTTLVQPYAELIPFLLDPNLRLAEDSRAEARDSDLPGRDQVLARLDCGGDRRAAMWLPPPARLSMEVELSAGDRLRLGTGFDRAVSATPEGDVMFRVTWTGPDGKTHTLLDSLGDPDRWTDHEIKITSSMAGAGILTFATEGDEQNVLSGFTNPRIIPVVQTPRPNVIVYLIDTLRADHLSCYGAENKTSPSLDAVAEDGFLFERCYSPASWTRPATTSLLSGLYPTSHGVLGTDIGLPTSMLTIAEAMQSGGYSTWGLVTNPQIFARGLNFEQGFHRFLANDCIVAKDPEQGSLSSCRVNDTAFPLLEASGDEPFFLYLHSIDPHSPYTVPEGFENPFYGDYKGVLAGCSLAPKLEFGAIENEIGDQDIAYLKSVYDAAIRYQDDQVGRLLVKLDELGIYDNTILVFVSDHGEEFREHGQWEHGGRMWNELVHVPLILSIPEGVHPGLTPPQRVPAPVSLTDVMPSLLDLLGLNSAMSCQGTSFLPFMLDRYAEDQPVYVEERENLGSFIAGSWKLIWKKQKKGELRELYNLRDDPDEQNDLSEKHPEIVEGLVRQRDKMAERFEATSLIGEANSVEINDEAKSQLRELGYIE